MAWNRCGFSFCGAFIILKNSLHKILYPQKFTVVLKIPREHCHLKSVISKLLDLSASMFWLKHVKLSFLDGLVLNPENVTTK